MGETFHIEGRTLCVDCANKFAAGGGNCEGARQHIDPTVCANCGADGGDVPHAELASLPTCSTCIEFFRNRPYPAWVKAFFAGVLILVAVSLVWNWRFFQAYFEIKGAFAALSVGDSDKAIEQISAAEKHASEAKHLSTTANFIRGVACLQKNRCAEAESYFARCGAVSPESGLAFLKQEAAIGAAFERKDYERFLKLSEEFESQHPNEAMAVAQVASAHACVYAVRGNPESRKAAEAKLDQARKLDPKVLGEDSYEQRIRYRLETREIIDKGEFAKRFPNGWKPSTKRKT